MNRERFIVTACGTWPIFDEPVFEEAGNRPRERRTAMKDRPEPDPDRLPIEAWLFIALFIATIAGALFTALSN